MSFRRKLVKWYESVIHKFFDKNSFKTSRAHALFARQTDPSLNPFPNKASNRCLRLFFLNKNRKQKTNTIRIPNRSLSFKTSHKQIVPLKLPS
jgi:hypothetical protein